MAGCHKAHFHLHIGADSTAVSALPELLQIVKSHLAKVVADNPKCNLKLKNLLNAKTTSKRSAMICIDLGSDNKDAL